MDKFSLNYNLGELGKVEEGGDKEFYLRTIEPSEYNKLLNKIYENQLSERELANLLYKIIREGIMREHFHHVLSIENLLIAIASSRNSSSGILNLIISLFRGLDINPSSTIFPYVIKACFNNPNSDNSTISYLIDLLVDKEIIEMRLENLINLLGRRLTPDHLSKIIESCRKFSNNNLNLMLKHPSMTEENKDKLRKKILRLDNKTEMEDREDYYDLYGEKGFRGRQSPQAREIWNKGLPEISGPNAPGQNLSGENLSALNISTRDGAKAIIEYFKDKESNLPEDLLRVIYRYITANPGDNFISQMLSNAEISGANRGGILNTLKIYHTLIRKINLGTFSNTKFQDFIRELTETLGAEWDDYLKTIFTSIVGNLNLKNDDQIIPLFDKISKLERVFHNNGYKLVDNKDRMPQNYVTDAFISIIKSGWDPDQDVTGKFINIAINKAIDHYLNGSHDISSAKDLLMRAGTTYDQFRNNIISMRQLIADQKPIPFSMKNKIYEIDNLINVILNSDSYAKLSEVSEKKREELFFLNFAKY